MKRLIKLIDGLSNIAGAVSAVMLCASLLMVIGEVVLRSFFSKTLYITDEYTGYLMAGITFFGLAYCLKEKGHIRMTVMHRFLKGRKRAWLDTLTFSIGFALMSIVTYTTFNFFWEAVLYKTQSMQISKTYLAIPKSLLPLGSFLFALQFLSEILKSMVQIRENDFPDLSREEELEQALEQEAGLEEAPEGGAAQ